MALTVTHALVSAIADDPVAAAAGEVVPSDWNADHTITVTSLTIATGTITASEPVLDLSQTWNNAAVTFTGIKLNVTNTASAAASLLMDLQVGGVSKLSLRNDGNVGIGTGSPDYMLDVLDADNGDNTLIGIRANNKTIGFGMSYQGIKAIGTNSFIDISLSSKGSGYIWLGQDTGGTGYRISTTDSGNNNIWFGNRTVGMTANSGNKIHISQTSSLQTGLTVETTNGYVGIGTVAPATQLSIGSANGQQCGIHSLTELLTIAAAATSTTTIQKPANSIILGVSVRVTTAVTCTSTFTVGDAGSATRFSTAAVSKAVNTTDKGTAAGAYYNATAEGIVITPDTVPSDATGRVRVTIYYIELTPPTS